MNGVEIEIVTGDPDNTSNYNTIYYEFYQAARALNCARAETIWKFIHPMAKIVHRFENLPEKKYVNLYGIVNLAHHAGETIHEQCRIAQMFVIKAYYIFKK